MANGPHGQWSSSACVICRKERWIPTVLALPSISGNPPFFSHFSASLQYLAFTFEMLPSPVSSVGSSVTQSLTFSSFHGVDQCIPNEVLNLIASYVAGGAVPLGSRCVSYPALAAVSRVCRQAVLGLKVDLPNPVYPSSNRHLLLLPPVGVSLRHWKRPVDCRPRLGEALYFPNLDSVIKFFETGPGRLHEGHHKHCWQCERRPPRRTIRSVTFISIGYLDEDVVGRVTHKLAYQAFETLLYNLHQMQLERLHIRLHGSKKMFSLNDPAVWSLSKIRGLTTLSIDGRRSCVDLPLKRELQRHTRTLGSSEWQPIRPEDCGRRMSAGERPITGRSGIALNAYYRLERECQRRHDERLRGCRLLNDSAKRRAATALRNRPPSRKESELAALQGWSVTRMRAVEARDMAVAAREAKVYRDKIVEVSHQRRLVLERFTSHQVGGARAVVL